MEKEKELQRLMYEYEYLQQNLQYLKAQLDQIIKAIEELQVLKVGLKNIRETEVGTEMLVPLGASVYAFASLAKNGEVLVGIGAGVYVRKSIEEALPLVDNQIEVLKKQQEVIMNNINLLSNQLTELQNAILKLRQASEIAGG